MLIMIIILYEEITKNYKNIVFTKFLGYPVCVWDSNIENNQITLKESLWNLIISTKKIYH